jgi:single-strand DNA-binding protein
MNVVVLKGNLTKDIELKYTPGGIAVGKTSIAIADGYGDKQKTFFFNLTFFGKTAEMVNQHFHKGSQILIKGKLQQDTWVDNNGYKKQAVGVIVENVEFCGSKNNQTSNGEANKAQNYGNDTAKTPNQSSNGEANLPSVDIDEDEIPF